MDAAVVLDSPLILTRLVLPCQDEVDIKNKATKDKQVNFCSKQYMIRSQKFYFFHSVIISDHGALIYDHVRLNPIEILGLFCDIFVTMNTFYFILHIWEIKILEYVFDIFAISISTFITTTFHKGSKKEKPIVVGWFLTKKRMATT